MKRENVLQNIFSYSFYIGVKLGRMYWKAEDECTDKGDCRIRLLTLLPKYYPGIRVKILRKITKVLKPSQATAHPTLKSCSSSV
jgi:hypothetical protein